MTQHTKQCLFCDQDFITKRSDAKYCCNSHRQLAYLEKQPPIISARKALYDLEFQRITRELETEYKTRQERAR